MARPIATSTTTPARASVPSSVPVMSGAATTRVTSTIPERTRMLVGSARSLGIHPTVVSPRAMLPKKSRTKRSETATARTVTRAMTRSGRALATPPHQRRDRGEDEAGEALRVVARGVEEGERDEHPGVEDADAGDQDGPAQRHPDAAPHGRGLHHLDCRAP